MADVGVATCMLRGAVALLAVVGAVCAPTAARANGAAVEHVRVNGVPLAVVRREVRGAPEQLAEALQQRWRIERPGDWIWRSTSARRVLLARQQGPLHESWLIRARPGGPGSEIIVSILDASRRASPVAPPPFPWPREARLLSVVEPGSRSGGASVEYLLVSDQPLAAAHPAWVAASRRAGWRATKLLGRACLVSHRGRDELVTCFESQGAVTSVVVQWRPA